MGLRAVSRVALPLLYLFGDVNAVTATLFSTSPPKNGGKPIENKYRCPSFRGGATDGVWFGGVVGGQAGVGEVLWAMGAVGWAED